MEIHIDSDFVDQVAYRIHFLSSLNICRSMDLMKLRVLFSLEGGIFHKDSQEIPNEKAFAEYPQSYKLCQCTCESSLGCRNAIQRCAAGIRISSILLSFK